MPRLFNFLALGKQKEQQAKKWLIKQGIEIIAENHRCKGGEIDLIGLQLQTLIFFEVKYRKSADFGHPAEMVNAKKQQHIINCAQQFLQKHPKYQTLAMQFDVITFSADNQEPEWIRNAFQAW
jgi:putative endonuclease